MSNGTTTTINHTIREDVDHTYGLEFRYFGYNKMWTRWFASMEDRRRFEESNSLMTLNFLRGSKRMIDTKSDGEDLSRHPTGCKCQI